jgi:hypothetical protein
MRPLAVALLLAGCYDFGALRPQPSLCASFGGLMCDGFEDKLPAPSGWTTSIGTNSGSVAVDDQHVYRGSYALHIHADATNSTPTMLGDIGGRVNTPRSFFDGPGIEQAVQHVWMRLFLFQPALVPGRLAPMNVERRATAALGVATADLYIESGSYVLADQAMQSTPGPMSAIHRWVCLELEWDNNAGQGRLDVDGAPVLSLSGPPLRKDPNDPMSLNVDFIAFGYFNSRSVVQVPAFDAWIDEIALDTKPIGCTR